MKKRSYKATPRILFVFGLIFLSCPARDSLRANLDDPATLTDQLKHTCKCLADPPWAAGLDRSIRPIVSPELDPSILPVDVSLTSNSTCGTSCQPCFDCFAWQLFIALNWPGPSPDNLTADQFGAPGDYHPVIWETYEDIFDIFEDPHRSLPVWGENTRQAPVIDDHRLVEASSAVNSRTILEERQADYEWLTDQDGKIVRYEIRVNKDLYEYIRQNHLNNQEGLYQAFVSGEGMHLPDGPTEKYGGHGAIEIKAAWRLVPKDKLEDYKKRFKISYAKTRREGDAVPMALVGLHIVKKTPHSPQFVWATFEHEDNAPDLNSPVPAGRDWSFYNPKESDDTYTPSWADPPDRDNADLPNRPVQVRRAIPIGRDAESINTLMHQVIKLRFGNSVWLHYKLVNVQWPFNPQPAPKVAARIPTSEQRFDLDPMPLPHGSPQPRAVANVTMETYLQGENTEGFSQRSPGEPPGRSSCIDCHRRAAITPTFASSIQDDYRRRSGTTSASKTSIRWWTDYSAIFYKAKAMIPN